MFRLIVLFAGAFGSSVPALFHFITVQGTTLASTNDVRVQVQAPADYRILRPTSRHATFDGHHYEVTLAALASKSDLVMLHAEKVTDGSGASDYDKLPNSSWPDKGFHTRSQCASIAVDDIAGEHDLKWLANRGWSPVGNLALEQHLKSTSDHNQEVVVSLIAKVADCNDKPAVEAALGRLRSKVRVNVL